jgi:hypothetical protein
MGDGGGGRTKLTYGFYHETASAFHPKQPCGRSGHSLVAHHSSTAYRVSLGHLSTGGDDRVHSRGDQDAWITFWFDFEKNDWIEAQQRSICGDCGLFVRIFVKVSRGFEGRWWWFLKR